MKEMETATQRYVGLDIGKRTYEMAIVGKGGKVTLSNGKTHPSGRQALYKQLRSGDKVGLEAGNLAFIMANEIEQAVPGCRVFVLNPSNLALIYGTMKKTDKIDAVKLAHVLEDYKEERLPVVPVPSEKEMHRRKLLSSYQRAQQSRNRKINQLHALFVFQGITTKVRSDLSTSASRKEAIKELSGIEREEAEYLVQSLELSEERIRKLEKQMQEDAAGDEEIERLQSIPGVGPKVSFAFVAHVAAERFENAGQVSNYLGLVPRVYISGDTVKYGRITKRGNGYVRALLVQAACALIRTKAGGKLKARYLYMTQEKSKSKKKAIVAIARRLAEEMYTLLRDGTSHEFRPFTPEKNKGKKMAKLALSA